MKKRSSQLSLAIGPSRFVPIQFDKVHNHFTRLDSHRSIRTTAVRIVLLRQSKKSVLEDCSSTISWFTADFQLRGRGLDLFTSMIDTLTVHHDSGRYIRKLFAFESKALSAHS